MPDDTSAEIDRRGQAINTQEAQQRESALGRYLGYVISRNRYLQLQGIRSGGRLVNIEIEHIYITRMVE